MHVTQSESRGYVSAYIFKMLLIGEKLPKFSLFYVF